MGQVQCLLGFRCNNFVMLASDQNQSLGVVISKDDHHNLHQINNSMVLGAIGDGADCYQLAEYMRRTVQLYKIRNGYELSPAATVHFTRNNLADNNYFHGGNQYSVNLLLAGYDKDEGPKLYYIDGFGTALEMTTCSQGVAGTLCTTVMDRYYKPDLTEEQGYNLMKICIKEIGKRYYFSLPLFQVTSINEHGIKDLPQIVGAELR